MRNPKAKLTVLLLIATLLYSSCMLFDYFSRYDDKNLVEHMDLSTWTTTVSSSALPKYMTYEQVTAAAAGTSGLPDESALIYRLENDNLVPDGDFESGTTGALPRAGWTASGGTCAIENGTHNLTGNALSYDLLNTEWVDYDLDQLSDGAVPGSIYTFRYSLQCTSGTYYFEIENNILASNQAQYSPFVPASGVNQLLRVPDDFNEHDTTEFLIDTTGSKNFRINLNTDGQVQAGYIDDFRIIKTDRDQKLVIDIPYEDADRVDGLELISGTYRFSIWVKADPEAAARNNSFASNAVSLQIESISEDVSAYNSGPTAFQAADYSSFSSWTEIYIDYALQIDSPEDTSTAVIRLSVSPTDTTGGPITADSGAVLISTPSLMFSSNGTFPE